MISSMIVPQHIATDSLLKEIERAPPTKAQRDADAGSSQDGFDPPQLSTLLMFQADKM